MGLRYFLFGIWFLACSDLDTTEGGFATQTDSEDCTTHSVTVPKNEDPYTLSLVPMGPEIQDSSGNPFSSTSKFSVAEAPKDTFSISTDSTTANLGSWTLAEDRKMNYVYPNSYAALNGSDSTCPATSSPTVFGPKKCTKHADCNDNSSSDTLPYTLSIPDVLGEGARSAFFIQNSLCHEGNCVDIPTRSDHIFPKGDSEIQYPFYHAKSNSWTVGLNEWVACKYKVKSEGGAGNSGCVDDPTVTAEDIQTLPLCSASADSSPEGGCQLRVPFYQFNCGSLNEADCKNSYYGCEWNDGSTDSGYCSSLKMDFQATYPADQVSGKANVVTFTPRFPSSKYFQTRSSTNFCSDLSSSTQEQFVNIGAINPETTFKISLFPGDNSEFSKQPTLASDISSRSQTYNLYDYCNTKTTNLPKLENPKTCTKHGDCYRANDTAPYPMVSNIPAGKAESYTTLNLPTSLCYKKASQDTGYCVDIARETLNYEDDQNLSFISFPRYFCQDAAWIPSSTEWVEYAVNPSGSGESELCDIGSQDLSKLSNCTLRLPFCRLDCSRFSEQACTIDRGCTPMLDKNENFQYCASDTIDPAYFYAANPIPPNDPCLTTANNDKATCNASPDGCIYGSSDDTSCTSKPRSTFCPTLTSDKCPADSAPSLCMWSKQQSKCVVQWWDGSADYNVRYPSNLYFRKATN